MGIYSSLFNRHPLNEAEVDENNNKPKTEDDDDDYTKGADTAADDESNDDAPTDEGGGDDDVDYTQGAEDEGDDNTDDSAGDQEGENDTSGSEDDDIDYTDGANDDSGDESDDASGDNPDGSEDSDDGDVDYTDGADDGDSNESDDADVDSEEQSDEEDEGDGEDNTYEDLRKIEAELFSNLSPEQIEIKSKELKQRFIDVYGTISSVILRINDIPKTDTNVEVLHFVTDKLMELKELVDFTVQKAFDTKTYIENSINYQICLTTLDNISDIIASVTNVDNPDEEKDKDDDENGVIIGKTDDSEIVPDDDGMVSFGDKMVESANTRFNSFF